MLDEVQGFGRSTVQTEWRAAPEIGAYAKHNPGKGGAAATQRDEFLQEYSNLRPPELSTQAREGSLLVGYENNKVFAPITKVRAQTVLE